MTFSFAPLLLTLLSLASSSQAQTLLFADDFSGSGLPDPALWDSYVNAGSLGESAGVLGLRSTGTTYPYMRTQPGVLPPAHGGWTLEVRLAWPVTNAGGVGFGAGAPEQANGAISCSGGGASNYMGMASLWRDGHVASTTQVTAGDALIYLGTQDAAMHSYLWRSTGLTIEFFYDGQLRATGNQPVASLETVWIGNSCSSFGGTWTELDIDLVTLTLDEGGAYCFGAESGPSCPCGGDPILPSGCLNTGGTGTTLAATGTASVSNDTFQLHVAGAPGAIPGLVIRGDNRISNPAGDGLLCTSSNSQRSQVQITSGGVTSFGQFKGAPFGATANLGGLATNYQFWYRDPGATCSGSGFNFSNAWSVVWMP